MLTYSSSQQPWSTYAVHLTTLTAWALLSDSLLIYWLCQATKYWPSRERIIALCLLGSWMFLTKWVKLVGHYYRYPQDILLMPLSILFGYAHGFIKFYAMLTLNVVSHVFIFQAIKIESGSSNTFRSTLSRYFCYTQACMMYHPTNH